GVAMMMRRAVVLLVAVYAVACATSTTPPKSAVAPAPAKSSVAKLQADHYRRAIESAYNEIVAREGKPVAEPRVDVEAAESIPIPDHATIRGALQYFTTDLKPSINESPVR